MKIKLFLSQEAEWEDYFIQESALELKATIDAMVYELYGLSEEEIAKVEPSKTLNLFVNNSVYEYR